MFIFKLIVYILKLFSLPYRIVKSVLKREDLDRSDAEKLLGVLRDKEDE